VRGHEQHKVRQFMSFSQNPPSPDAQCSLSYHRIPGTGIQLMPQYRESLSSTEHWPCKWATR